VLQLGKADSRHVAVQSASYLESALEFFFFFQNKLRVVQMPVQLLGTLRQNHLSPQV
jgi:hypothetical protein